MRAGLVAGLLLASLAGPYPGADAAATKLVVTKLTDDAPNGCKKNDCSLREAILRANATKEVETIVLLGGTHDLTIAGEDENGSLTGDLDILRPVKIRGKPGTSVIRQTTTDRVLHVLDKGALNLKGVEVTGGDVLSGNGGGILATQDRPVTLRNSAVTLNDAQADGGGIWTRGSLTLTDSVVSDNVAGGGGGGIFAQEEDVTLNRSSVHDNVAEAFFGVGGGGVFVRGPGHLRVADSTVADNAVTGSGLGGGIYLEGGGGQPEDGMGLTLERSTVSGNDALSGGGLYLDRNPTQAVPLEMVNSTISGNSATSFGGGIRCSCPDDPDAGVPPARLTHMTITANTADSDNNSGSPSGGGIESAQGFGGTPVEVRASIVADNFDAGQTDQDCANDPFTTLGANVVTQASCLSPAADPTDSVVATASLGALNDNGGYSHTHAVGDGGPAEDVFGGAGCGGTDQRGVPRPGGDECDSGAYERAYCHGVFANIVGTTGPDVLVGTSGSDGILGLGGKDVIDGGEGDDAICGGSGNDRLFGGDDDDILDGGPGKKDKCFGGAGTDTFIKCEKKKQD